MKLFNPTSNDSNADIDDLNADLPDYDFNKGSGLYLGLYQIMESELPEFEPFDDVEITAITPTGLTIKKDGEEKEYSFSSLRGTTAIRDEDFENLLK